MANQTITVDIVTQEQQLLSTEAKQVSLPAAQGEITVLPGHRALASTMLAGEVAIWDTKGQVQYLVVSPGFIQVDHNHVTVLADSAIREEDLDEQKALQAKQAAEQAMSDLHSQSEIAMTLGTIERSLMELRALKRRPKHRASR